METNSLWHAPRVATLVLVVHLFCGLMPGLKAQNFQLTKRFVPSFFLANDQTLILHQDLHLYSDRDVQIDGNVLGQAITQSNAPAQNLFIYAKGDIIINGEIRLSKGGDGQVPELAGLKKNQPYSSSFFAIGTTSGSFYQLAFSAQPFFDVRNGGKGGSLFLEARRIIINGVIQPGDGGDGVAGGAGGSGGTLILLSSIVQHPGMYTLKAGNGGNGGDASQGLPQAGAGGNGGMAVIFACTDGTPGTNGVVSGVAGTGGGNGGTDNDGIACQGGKGGNGGARAAGGAGGNGGSATNTLAGGSALGGAGGDGGNGGDADVSIPGGAGGKGGNGGNGTGSNGSSGSCIAANGGAGFGGAGGKGGNGGDGFLDVIAAGSGGNGGTGGNGTGGNAGTCVAVSCSTPTGGAGTGGTGGAGGSRGTGNIVLGGVNGTAGSQGTSTNGLNGSCTLPIELSQFSATSTSSNVRLYWSTSSEINNDYMAIERSSNGQNFLEIGRIPGKGTSTETQHYSFIDEQPLQGNNYYRLRQVDFDQNVEYSKVIVQNFKHGQLLSVFPNPARDKVYLQTPLNLEQAKVQLIDAIGRKISINLLGATGWYELALPTDLPRGHYWVVIQNESTQLQTLLIKE